MFKNNQVNEAVRKKENTERLEWIQNHVQCDGAAEVFFHIYFFFPNIEPVMSFIAFEEAVGYIC